MNGNRITLITLGVSDLATSKAYYEAIGFVAEESPPSVVFFRCGTYFFGLFPLEELAKELGRPVDDLKNGAMTLSQNHPSPEAVDAAIKRALHAGATEVAPAKQMSWGGYSGYVSDPDGHIWEYSHNPFWTYDDDGYLA